MKFQLIIDAQTKRLVIIPESANEAVLLATILDPNSPKDINSDDSNEYGMKRAEVTVKATNDRPPYRKITELHITL